MDFYRPDTLAGALELKAEHPGALPIAGGTDVMVEINFDTRRPPALLDLTRIGELTEWSRDGAWLRIGAGVSYARLISELGGLLPGLSLAARTVGSPQIRNRGTIGGSIAHADPAAEIPAVLVALGGEVTARGPKGTRTIRADELFVTYLTTAVDAREVLTEVRIPATPRGAGWSWMEIARRHGDFALAGVGVMLALRRGMIADARIGLTGVGPVPVRAGAAERLLTGSAPSEELWRRAADAVRGAIEPDGDLHASADYRRHVAGVLTVRALREALGRAASSGAGASGRRTVA